MQGTTPKITIFTTTFNRAKYLIRGYEALKRQTSKDFQWMIINDGSSDETEEIVNNWIVDGIVPIIYIKKQNGGMHTGYSLAYQSIDTELCIACDDDDYLCDNAIELILKRWEEDGNEKFAGLIGLDIFHDGSIVGTKFPEGLKSARSWELPIKYGVYCDKKYVLRTEIVKKYMPYPDENIDKFIPPNLVYLQIDQNYEWLCYNDSYCVVEYLGDGSTLNMFKQYKNHAKGFNVERNIGMSLHPIFKYRIRYAIHYVSGAIFSKDYKFIQKASNKLILPLAIIPGIILNLFIRYKLRYS